MLSISLSGRQLQADQSQVLGVWRGRFKSALLRDPSAPTLATGQSLVKRFIYP